MAPSSPTRTEAVATVHDLRADLLGELDTARVPLDRIAGRLLAEAVEAERDVPPRSQATMDGFAVAAADDQPLALRERTTGPGDDPVEHELGTATRVRTGGPVPEGADAVVVRERATVDDGEVRVGGGSVTAGQHVVERGSVVVGGATVFESGHRLASRDAAILRELCREDVAVRERISTAILATGTEIHDGAEPDRDSDALANFVRAWGGDPALAGSVPDDPDRVGDRIAALAADHDVILTTGGTGVSAADETAGALADRAQVRLTDAALRPGSGTTAAWLPEAAAAVVALPGPPGAMLASATVLARPLFVDPSREATVTATAACGLAVPDRDVEFVVPVELRDTAAEVGETRLRAIPFGSPDSTVQLYGERYRPHLVSSCPHLSAADGFVVTGEGFAAGESLAVVPYEVVG